MNETKKKSEKKILFSIALIFFDILIFLLLHGTKNFYIFKMINPLEQLIPSFDGISCSNKLIKGYLVDFIWILGFNIFASISENKKIHFFVLLVAILLELMQLKFKTLGTFDLYDILIYVLVSFWFIIIKGKT